MKPKYDVAIIGLGAMGSAAAHALAASNCRVVAFDRFAPPHSLGSSHGHTRIIREAYYEHPLYVPLVRRAYQLWAALERETGSSVLRITGGLMVGQRDGPLFRGALTSAQAHGIEHEILDARELSLRFPAYLPRKDVLGLLEHRAGILYPERCVEAHLALAASRGAHLHLKEAVERWTTSARGVTLTTPLGAYEADRLVVAAGAWLPTLASSVQVRLPLEIERQLSHWFEPEIPAAAKYDAANCPVALWEMPGADVFATLPNEGHGVKCGVHHAGAATAPDAVDRVVSPSENAAARELLETVMPGAGGRLLESRVCLYTNTPDRHFLIDWLDGDRVLLVSPCSGHGFKFASAIGEIVAQLIRDGRSWLDLKPFALSRF